MLILTLINHKITLYSKKNYTLFNNFILFSATWVKLLEKTIPNFIKEEKKFEKFTILPFIAAMSFEKNVLQFAKQHNIGLLKYRGEHFKVINK